MTWAVVLIKGFDAAKQRLSSALDAPARAALARKNAARAIAAARPADHVLVVAGGDEPARLARLSGVEVLLESSPGGQNLAASRGIQHAVERGAGAVLLLSSDLPLVTPRAVRRFLRTAERLPAPAVLAAPAYGRGGTNALYLRPPGAVSLHFGADSLALFRADASARGADFRLYRSRTLALDLDTPEDLARLARLTSPARGPRGAMVASA
jgi:2-phospho-L-lactate guanylyltransferase